MASTDEENRKQQDGEEEEEEVGTPVECFKSKEACKGCCCGLNNYWKALIGVSIIFFYLLLGGLFFLLLESPAEQAKIAEIQQERAEAIRDFEEFVDNFTQRIVSVGIPEEEAQNLTNLIVSLAVSVAEANSTLPIETDPIWDYASSVFFASTVITTIGYGTIAPATEGGQILFIFYCLVGIPLALIFLSTLGSILSDWLDATLDAATKKFIKSPVARRALGTTVAVVLTLIFFILIPAGIFWAVERPNEWSYLNSVYFCFVTLTTVGFGDFVPGIEGSTISDNRSLIGIYRLITAIWVWIGLALVATLISEVQELFQAMGKAIHRRGKKMRSKVRYSTHNERSNQELTAMVVGEDTHEKQSLSAQEEVVPSGEEQTAEEA